MTSYDADQLCRRCGRQVRVSSEHYATFEQMHYVCFHYEFEHDPVDPDDECGAGGCPSASLSGGRDRVIETASELAGQALQGAPWSNDTVGRYLDAFSRWLAASGGYNKNRDDVPPGNGWVVVADALRAARSYE